LLVVGCQLLRIFFPVGWGFPRKTPLKWAMPTLDTIAKIKQNPIFPLPSCLVQVVHKIFFLLHWQN
jgi:hypothetical protein